MRQTCIRGLVALTLLLPGLVQAQEYTYVDLGQVMVLRVDPDGKGIGAIVNGPLLQAAILEHGQPPQLLGVLPGGGLSQAFGANNARVVGDSQAGENGLTTHAWVFENGTLRDLGTLGDPGLFSSAAALNAQAAI